MNRKEEIIKILKKNSVNFVYTDDNSFNIDGVDKDDFNEVAKQIVKKLTLTDVVKSLEIKEEIVFEDWLKQHRFTKDINDYVKNNITYREWEVFNMYTMDVYSL